MALLGFELIFRLLWGWLLILTTISRKETSERFLRFAIYFAVGFAASAAWLFHASGLSSATNSLAVYGSVGGLVLGSLVYAFVNPRFARIAGFLTVLASPIAIFATRTNHEIVNFFLGALFLGSISMGLYLGHWYLNVPGMHIRELKNVTWLIIGSLALKVAENMWTLFVRIGMEPPLTIDSMGRPLGIPVETSSMESMSVSETILGLTGDGAFGLGFYGLMMLLMRVLWDLLAPLILVWMVKKTVDIRSTQSATGILYALFVMALIGEGAAIYFWRYLGWTL